MSNQNELIVQIYSDNEEACVAIWGELGEEATLSEVVEEWCKRNNFPFPVEESPEP